MSLPTRSRSTTRKTEERAQSKKRPPSPDASSLPTRKRSQTSKALLPTPPAEPKRASRRAAPSPKRGGLKKTPSTSSSFVNQIPSPPEHTRPSFQLFGWGMNDFGQLGLGPVDDPGAMYSKPKRNVWIEQRIEQGDVFGEGKGAGLVAVAAGGMHTLFIDERGTVWSSGVNDEGCLGRVTEKVPDPSNPKVFLDADELSGTPYPIQSLLDEKFRAVRIAAGDSMSAAISLEGDLRVWGSFRDSNGLLGFSNDSKRQFTPIRVPHITEKCVSIAAGNNHLLILTVDGNLYALGVGEEGQLGRKVIQRRKINGTVPARIILGTKSRKAVVVGAGNYHSFAVDDKGDVWGWGMNTMGQTGTGVERLGVDTEVSAPKPVIGLSKEELGGQTVVEIVGGDHHTLFLTSDGKVYGCGRSNNGQLGLADDHPDFKDRQFPDFLPEPVLIAFPEDTDPIVHISAGTHNNLAVTNTGVMFAWGQQTVGQLGIGSDSDGVSVPTVVVRKDGSWFTKATACGGQHSLALLRKRT